MAWLPLNLNPKALKASLEPQVPGLTYRAIFGGFGVYAHGNIVAGITDQGVAVKATLADEAAVRGLPNARPWQWDPHGPVSKQYVVVTESDAVRWLRERL